MFYTNGRMFKKRLGMAILFLLAAGVPFAQTEAVDAAPWGFVPEELLRPRREEVLRHPVDIVIGPLGPGRASRESYEFARRVASAFLAGDTDAPILSTVNRVFLDGYMAVLDVVNPRSFRIGSGQESPDGSVSFLIRFIGRDHGITGEIFVRQEERRPPPPVVEVPVELAYEGEDEYEADLVAYFDGDLAEVEEDEQPSLIPPAPPVYVPVELVWVFDDLVLESPRSREEENQVGRPQFGVSIYHRLF